MIISVQVAAFIVISVHMVQPNTVTASYAVFKAHLNRNQYFDMKRNTVIYILCGLRLQWAMKIPLSKARCPCHPQTLHQCEFLIVAGTPWVGT